MHEEFKNWFEERTNQRVREDIGDNIRSAKKFFAELNNFQDALNQVARLTGKYLESKKSEELANDGELAKFLAKQHLAKKLQAENAESLKQAQAKFEELKEPSKEYVNILISIFGGNYVIRNNAKAGKKNLIAVTDRGPEDGKVKTNDRVVERTSKYEKKSTAQLTYMNLNDLKKRIDSRAVVIVDIGQEEKGFTRITLDEFRPYRDLAFYQTALDKIQTAIAKFQEEPSQNDS